MTTEKEGIRVCNMMREKKYERQKMTESDRKYERQKINSNKMREENKNYRQKLFRK